MELVCSLRSWEDCYVLSTLSSWKRGRHVNERQSHDGFSWMRNPMSKQFDLLPIFLHLHQLPKNYLTALPCFASSAG